MAGTLHLEKTRAQLYDQSTNKIKWMQCDHSTAQDHLYANGFIKEKSDDLPGLKQLALMILRIAATSDSVVVADACRAVATMLELREEQTDLRQVAGDVRAILELVKEQKKVAANEEENIERLHEAAVTLTNTIQQQCDDINMLTTRTEDTVANLIERAKAQQETAPTRLVPTPTSPTYASITAAQPTREQAAILARAELRDRQILLEKTPGTETWMEGISEKEVMEKARLALEMLEGAGTGSEDRPTEIRCIGASLNKNESVLLHFDSKASTDWVKKHIGSFTGSFAGTCIYKERLYNVVAEFVPVTLDLGALHSVEADNNYPSGAIAKVRWIKPVERRSAGQRVAHAVVGFVDPHTANTFLRHGAWVEGKRVFGRKLLSEPVRCMKCQTIGQNHTAATCPSIHDTCARCAGFHRTSECVEGDDRRTCSNCKIAKRPCEGHGAADRACPVFLDKLQIALERNPDAKYLYFPVKDDPATWLTRDAEERRDRERRGQPTEWQRVAYARPRGPGPDPEEAANMRCSMTGRTARPMFGGAASVRMARGATDEQEEWGLTQPTIPDMLSRRRQKKPAPRINMQVHFHDDEPNQGTSTQA